MDFAQMTAPCGLDCFNCPAYRAKNNPQMREAIAKKMGISPELAICSGCRNEGGTIAFMGMTELCSAYQCAEARSLVFCYECGDFPCDNLHPYADRAGEVPHNTKVFNLCLIKKMGLENWAETKAGQVRETYFKGLFKL